MASDVKATNLTASGTVFAGRARVKAIHYKCGSNPSLVLRNKDVNGAVQLTLAFANNTDDNVYIPDEGMLFVEGCFAVLTNVSDVTVFFN
tara:strand:- start:312 stop:581 length:270 start_codon:yes stop_codon:yes gene_type:complete